MPPTGFSMLENAQAITQ